MCFVIDFKRLILLPPPQWLLIIALSSLVQNSVIHTHCKGNHFQTEWQIKTEKTKKAKTGEQKTEWHNGQSM